MDFPTIPPKPLSTASATALKAAAEGADDAKLRKTAQAFEATFLAEMLKYTGINQTPESTGGGAGEDAFASFLTQAYADEFSAHGGVGLAEQIFNALKRKDPA
jgi:Rod binding domain-containing protein